MYFGWYLFNRDLRQAWKIEYTLTDIIFLTLLEVIVDVESLEDIENYGYDKLGWARGCGDFKQGIPEHDNLAQVSTLFTPSSFKYA